MTKLEQAAQQALVALEDVMTDFDGSWALADKAITALREALAEQPEQEPVGVVEGSGEWGIAGVLVAGVPIGTKLYAAPVRTKDLTDDELHKIWRDIKSLVGLYSFQEIARAVIAADREKNRRQ